MESDPAQPFLLLRICSNFFEEGLPFPVGLVRFPGLVRDVALTFQAGILNRANPGAELFGNAFRFGFQVQDVRFQIAKSGNPLQ